MKRGIRGALLFIAVLALGTAATAIAGDAPAASKRRVVVQVSDGDAARWNMVLNNIQNVQAELGRDNVEIELVAYGPGIGMLKMDSSVAGRVAETLKSGARVVACENTMQKQSLSKDMMLPAIGYVRAGVVELMEKQREGFSYIRP